MAENTVVETVRDSEQTDRDGMQNPFIEAVGDEDFKRFKTLLQEDDEFINKHINEKNEDGNTALHLSIGNSDDFVKGLLDKRADCHIENAVGDTPLHIAARKDLVETLVLLIIHGADVRGHKDKTTNKITPAMMAKDENARGCLMLLLFCGAEFPEIKELPKSHSDKKPVKYSPDQLNEIDERDKHGQILNGFERSKVAYCGAKFGCNEVLAGEHREAIQKNLGISITLHDWESDLLFLCRRMDSSYQASSASGVPVIEQATGETLVSQIYQYIVIGGGTCDMNIEVFIDSDPELDKYRDIVLIQVRQDKAATYKREIFNGELLESKQAYFKNVKLSYNGTGRYLAMGVYSKNKIEKKEVNQDTNEEQIFESKVQPKFVTKLSPKALEGIQNIDIEVVKVDESLSQQNDITTSDFCSIDDSRKGSSSRSSNQTDDNTIDLPLPEAPKRSTTKTIVLQCRSGLKPEDGGSWERSLGHIDEDHDTGTVHIKGNGIGFGNYIVLVVESVKRCGYNLALLAKDLFMIASGKTVECILFAAVKRKDEFKFIVQVTLCSEKQQDQETSRLEDDFFLDPCSLVHMSMDTKLTFHIHLTVQHGKIFPEESLPIQYQDNHAKCHKFTVTQAKPDTTPDGYMAILKKVLPNKQNEGDNAVVKFPVSFELVSPIKRLAFPSDSFITMIAAGIGNSYFAIGIYLDIPAVKLQLLDCVNPTARGESVLKQWRLDYFPNGKEASTDKSLSKLFTSLKEARQINLRSIVCKEIQSNKNSREYEWLSSYKVRQGQNTDDFDFKLLKRKELCPFEDTFLYTVATEINTVTSILCELGVKEQEVASVQHFNTSSYRYAFEVLLMARNKDTIPTVKSLGTLINCIRYHDQNVTLENLKKMVEPWYKRMLIDPNQKYTQETLGKIKKIFKL